MSRSSGTGSPIAFRCAGCRRKHNSRHDAGPPVGYASGVDLTGRERKIRSTTTPRHSKIGREYRCRTCRHIGWSTHLDLERKAIATRPTGDAAEYADAIDLGRGLEREAIVVMLRTWSHGPSGAAYHTAAAAIERNDHSRRVGCIQDSHMLVAGESRCQCGAMPAPPPYDMLANKGGSDGRG